MTAEQDHERTRPEAQETANQPPSPSATYTGRSNPGPTQKTNQPQAESNPPRQRTTEETKEQEQEEQKEE